MISVLQQNKTAFLHIFSAHHTQIIFLLDTAYPMALKHVVKK